MKRTMIATSAAALIAGLTTATAVFAGEEDELVIDGETLVTKAPAPEGSPFSEVISGWRFRSDETQVLQMDDFDNPGMIYVDQGLDLWEAADGSEGKSCADCHGDIAGFAGLRAAMPKWSEELGTLATMEELINYSRTEHMGAEPWKWESNEMLSMTAAIGLQSRGMPVDVATDGPAETWWEKGREIYYTRFGQLDFSCANCHEDNYGNMLRADHLSQGQINGFPVYRLKWGGLGSIDRRFKGCVEDTRGVPFAVGSDEMKALELYVASRGTGLVIETPSVRQ